MIRLVPALLGSAALLAAGSAGAVTFTSAAYDAPLSPGQTLVVDFDNPAAAGYALSGTANVVSGFLSGQWAAPATGPGSHDTTQYMAVRTGETFVLNTPLLKSISVFVGSIDAYNKITFNFAGGGSQTLMGADLTATPNGDQGAAATNRRYNFDFGADRVNQITFESTGNSFEFDNIAAGAVPEPGTWAMMIGGFGMMGAALRRRRSLAVA